MKSGREAGYLPEAIGLVGRRNAVDHGALELVEVLLEEAVAEDANRILVGRRASAR